MTDAIDKVEAKTTRRENESFVELGSWYWVANRDGDGKWMGCVVKIGSNYVKLSGPADATSSYESRIHFDDFDERCELIEDPDPIIQGRIEKYQAQVRELMNEVKVITAKLAITPRGQLDSGAGNETQALSVSMSGQSYQGYKAELIKAKDKTLPELFEKITKANGCMAVWMKARILPMQAQASQLKKVIGDLEDRVFTVELYAGLVEEIVEIGEGTPAPNDTQIHLMQRRHYMDEECLAQYQVGGMEFKDIKAFDNWIAKPINRERLLPHPRCIVSFQVRFERKYREAVRIEDYVRIAHEAQLDRKTFLYMRNGTKMFRLSTEIDFDKKLFPDLGSAQFNTDKMWAKIFCNKVDELITDGHYQEMKAEHAAAVADYKKKKKAGKKFGDGDMPLWEPDDPTYGYEPFDKSSVYYDEMAAKIAADIKAHNRIALVLQGLLDRSPVMHPHPPWQLWTAEGFASALVLVYDDSRALNPAELPDFKAYRDACNKSIKPGSVVVGQQRRWLIAEGAKESKRIDRTRWGWNHHYRPDTHQPDGDPGPGDIARVTRLKRSKEHGLLAVFEWYRKRAHWTRRRWESQGKTDGLKRSFAVPVSKLLNIDAYKPGDFKQFFADPRTRHQYLKWAPLMLEAEEFHAGNRKIADPDEHREEEKGKK